MKRTICFIIFVQLMASYSWGLTMTYKKLCREMFNCTKSSEQRAGAKLFILGYLNGSSDASYIGLGRSKFKLMDLIPDDEFVKYNYIFFQTGLCDTLLDNFDADKFLNFLEQREDLSEYPLANSRMIFSRQELEDDPKGDLCIDAVRKEFFSD